MRVAVITCDHGLGHVRRSVLIADALVRSGCHVTLFAPRRAAARVRGALGIEIQEGLEEVDFATLTTPGALRRGEPASVRWEERLPDLAAFDRVVGDTLPEILAVRPDATLVAQFLWHDVLDGVDPAYRIRADRLTAAAGAVLGSAPFAMPAVQALPGFVEIGLFTSEGISSAPSDGEDLLVSGGTTSAITEELRAVVAALPTLGRGPSARVHVDRELLPADPPEWMVEATHSSAMYGMLAAALIRPGLGVVTELLSRSVPAWCVREPGNSELAHNARTLERMGAGHDLGELTPTVDAPTVARTLLAGAPREGARDASAQTRFDGAAAVAAFVVGH